MRAPFLLGLAVCATAACATTKQQQQEDDAFSVHMPVPPVMPVGSAAPLETPVDLSTACDPEPGKPIDIAWSHNARSAFPTGSYTLQDNCLTGVRLTGTYRYRVDPMVASQIADLVPRGGEHPFYPPLTTVHVTMDGRDDTLSFEPVPTCTNQFAKTSPERLKLELLLYDIEKRVLNAPYSLVVPRIIVPAGPVMANQPTTLQVVLENRGRVPVTVPRDVNALEVRGKSGRVSVAAEPERPIDIPVGMGRVVEIVAYFRDPGVNEVIAWLDASRSEPLTITISN